MGLSEFAEKLERVVIDNNLMVSSDMRFLIEPKILGVGGLLFYENGRLKRVHIQQGSLGVKEIPIGDLKDVRGLPNSISTRKISSVEVSGDFFLAPYDLQRHGVNMREGADLSGSSLLALGLLKSNKNIDKASLTFIAHGIRYSSVNLGQQRSKMLGALMELGFETPLEVILGGVEEGIQHADWLKIIRQTLGYPTDGIVVKLNDLIFSQQIKPYLDTTIAVTGER